MNVVAETRGIGLAEWDAVAAAASAAVEISPQRTTWRGILRVVFREIWFATVLSMGNRHSRWRERTGVLQVPPVN